METVPSREVEVYLFRWGLNFSEGVHLLQPLSERLVPGGPVLGRSIFVMARSQSYARPPNILYLYWDERMAGNVITGDL